MTKRKDRELKVIMLVSSLYDFDPRITKEAESLVNNGYQVKVFALDRSGEKKIYRKKWSKY